MRRILFVWLTLPLLCAAGGGALADAVFESTTGDVRFGPDQATTAATTGARVTSGSTVSTGANGRTLLRFDDGQAVALNPNTDFKITNFRFNRADPSQDNVVFELLKGALRSVSGLIGSRSARAFSLRTPAATIGIRGTDFMVVLEEDTSTSALPMILAQSGLTHGDARPAMGSAGFQLAQVGIKKLPRLNTYATVRTGRIDINPFPTSASQTPSTLQLNAGDYARSAFEGSWGGISEAQLPINVSSSFKSLGSLPISPSVGTGPAGANAAPVNATGGFGSGLVGPAAAVAAGAAALGARVSETGPTGSTGSTGTR